MGLSALVGSIWNSFRAEINCYSQTLIVCVKDQESINMVSNITEDDNICTFSINCNYILGICTSLSSENKLFSMSLLRYTQAHTIVYVNDPYNEYNMSVKYSELIKHSGQNIGHS